MTESTLRIGLILPEVLGTYGDSGNSEVLKRRALWRDISAEVVHVGLGQAVPADLDIYTIGGGEDLAQSLAIDALDKNRVIDRIIGANKPILAICAALQILGHWYEDARGNRVTGLGVLDCHTLPQGKRTIGEVVSTPLARGLDQPLTGFENHGGVTILGEDAAPLGRVAVGVGNGGEPGQAPSGFEGIVQASVIATYMHGPVLARNPQLADLLLERATGDQLPPLDLFEVEKLRTERLGLATSGNSVRKRVAPTNNSRQLTEGSG